MVLSAGTIAIGEMMPRRIHLILSGVNFAFLNWTFYEFTKNSNCSILEILSKIRTLSQGSAHSKYLTNVLELSEIFSPESTERRGAIKKPVAMERLQKVCSRSIKEV